MESEAGLETERTDPSSIRDRIVVTGNLCAMAARIAVVFLLVIAASSATTRSVHRQPAIGAWRNVPMKRACDSARPFPEEVFRQRRNDCRSGELFPISRDLPESSSEWMISLLSFSLMAVQ